jgi:hypothetical protein
MAFCARRLEGTVWFAFPHSTPPVGATTSFASLEVMPEIDDEAEVVINGRI